MLINDSDNTKIININNHNLYDIDNNIKVSPSLVVLYNNYIEKKELQEHNDFDNSKIQYLNNKRTLCYKKKYDEKILSLYKNGKLILDNKETNLKDYYIVYNTNDNIYHLINTDNPIDKKINYNKAIKFIDTTAFIELINNKEIIDNTVSIDENTLKAMVNRWNGKIHNKTWQTEAINNKNMIKEEI